MQKIPNIIEFRRNEKFARKAFKNIDSWHAWDVFNKSAFGLKMTVEEFELYQKCTGRKTIPKNGCDEIYAIVGRRGGKSSNMALIAVYMALFGNWKKHLGHGEEAFLFIIGVDRTQAKIILSYVKGLLSLFPDTIKRERTLDVELRNGITISVKPGSFRSSRGFTTICIILDELAFFRSEESANPAGEVITALLPTLVENGKLIGISTPYSRHGYLYQMYKNYYAKENEDCLIWKSETLIMNPVYNQKRMNKNIKRDRAKMHAEYYAEFRTDIENFLSEEAIKKIIMDIDWNPFQPGIRYKAFCDPAGGTGKGGDSFTLGIGHQTLEEKIVVDCVEEIKSPFDPYEAVEKISKTLKDYKIYEVIGDRFAPGWVSNAFKKQEIRYVTSDLTKSQLYLYLQPLINMAKVQIPKNERLKNQLFSLERKIQPGGKDSVDHPRNLHDDLANVIAGVCVIIDKGIFRKATKQELESRMPITHSRLYPWKNKLNELSRNARRRRTDKELEDEEKVITANREYKRRFSNDPAKEMDFLMREEQILCPRCHGKGIDFGESCGKCKGTGKISKYGKIT